MQNEITNLEENIAKGNNINKQLKEDFDKLQEKFETQKRIVSTEQQNPASEKCNSSVLEHGDSSTLLAEFSPDDKSIKLENLPECERKELVISPEKESTKSEKSLGNRNLLTDESNEIVLKSEQIFNKAKDALIHTFERYQDFCNTKLNSCGGRGSYGIKTNNLKLLPPLIHPVRKYSPNIDSDFLNKECFLSDINLRDGNKFPADLKLKDENKCWQSGELSKDFHCKFKTDDYEPYISESKLSVFEERIRKDKYANLSELSKQNNAQSQLQFSWLDD